MKDILQRTNIEANAFMQLMAKNVTEVMSASSLSALALTPGYALMPHLPGSQWQQDLRKWFSSPDPSTNHVVLCRAQHQGTANWFFGGSLFEEWKSAGSLFWIHGKRTSSTLSPVHFLTKTCI